MKCVYLVYTGSGCMAFCLWERNIYVESFSFTPETKEKLQLDASAKVISFPPLLHCKFTCFLPKK